MKILLLSLFLSLNALALPKFHFGQAVQVKDSCTDDVFFCNLLGLAGTVNRYDHTGSKYSYEIQFPVGKPECTWLWLPESCLKEFK